MKIDIKVSTVIIVILALFVAFFIGGRLSTLKSRNAQNYALVALSDTVSHYRIEISGLTNYISEKDQIILDQKRALEMGLIEKEELRKLSLRKGVIITTLKTRLSAAHDSIPVYTPVLLDSVPNLVDSGKAKNAVALPVDWKYSDDYLNLTAGIRANGKGWFQLTAPTPLKVYLGNKKTGLFGSTPTVTVSTLSPYLDVYDIQTINTMVTPWYRKWWVYPTVGVVAGIVTYSLVNSLGN